MKNVFGFVLRRSPANDSYLHWILYQMTTTIHFTWHTS